MPAPLPPLRFGAVILAAGASFGQFAIHEDDSVADYSLKIFDTTLHTLMEVREHLDPQALQKAINAIASAQRIEFYGFGASGAVAADAQHKFFRLLLTAAVALPFDLASEPSALEVPTDRLEFARASAGFWHSHLSPLHGALIASTIANGGVRMNPMLVDAILDRCIAQSIKGLRFPGTFGDGAYTWVFATR